MYRSIWDHGQPTHSRLHQTATLLRCRSSSPSLCPSPFPSLLCRAPISHPRPPSLVAAPAGSLSAWPRIFSHPPDHLKSSPGSSAHGNERRLTHPDTRNPQTRKPGLFPLQSRAQQIHSMLPASRTATSTKYTHQWPALRRSQRNFFQASPSRRRVRPPPPTPPRLPTARGIHPPDHPTNNRSRTSNTSLRIVIHKSPSLNHKRSFMTTLARRTTRPTPWAHELGHAALGCCCYELIHLRVNCHSSIIDPSSPRACLILLVSILHRFQPALH